ncbi:MAG TPA: DUF2235 domain-containing protein [Vicinamibacterales bacterium]|nr:DUF2235 domain-containing protein [Vicinamibacterales bacterium]
MKRIVICADGTWNERDQINEDTGRPRPTNVTKVARAVRSRAANGIDQIVFYLDGIGTRGPLDKVSGGAFGHGMERNIRELYRAIVYNHEPNDELFFFGFSRGAFTVRTLAGFMRKVGMIEKEGDYYVPEIYACYEKGATEGSVEWTKAFHNVKSRGPCPPIKFIGVWDTVGALGAPGFLGQFINPAKYKYHDVSLGPEIQNAYHALAVDERRRPFKPNLWDRPPGWNGRLEQAWFAGVHSNVGGGYAPDGLANEALHWIVEKAEQLGLEFDNDYLKPFLPCFNSKLRDSMTPMYRAMLPMTRDVAKHTAAGEAVHQSTLDRLQLAGVNYAPPAAAALRTLPVVTTTRVSRGQPCPDLP